MKPIAYLAALLVAGAGTLAAQDTSHAAAPATAPAPAAAQTALMSTRAASPQTQYLRCFIHSPFLSVASVDSDSFSLRCRWNPAQRQPFQRRDGEVEHKAE